MEVRTYVHVGGLKRALSRVLHRLVAQEGVFPKDIVILTPRKRERSHVWRMGPVGNFQLADQRSSGSGEVFCSTVHSFKGLESPAVILAEIEPYGALDLETVLYVGCSRACNHLVVLASERLSEDVRHRLKPS